MPTFKREGSQWTPDEMEKFRGRVDDTYKRGSRPPVDFRKIFRSDELGALDLVAARLKKDKNLAAAWGIIQARVELIYSDCVAAEKARDENYERAFETQAKLVEAQNDIAAMRALVGKLQVIIGNVLPPRAPVREFDDGGLSFGETVFVAHFRRLRDGGFEPADDATHKLISDWTERYKDTPRNRWELGMDMGKGDFNGQKPPHE